MFTLYKFELRKIISRKIVWITGGLLLVGLLIWGVASAILPQNREYSDSSLNGYVANRAEQEAAEQISGREINQTLIDEMRPAYENFIFNGNYKEALPYLDVYNLIGETLGTQASAEILECDSETFYEKLNAQLEANIPTGLTESISFDEPIVYHGYFDGWRQITDMMKLIACMEIMFIVICLSTVFTVEHTRRTDQIILCTHLGKKKLYTVKILAGLTVGIGFTILLSLLMLGIIAFLYGFDGYDTILQFVLLRPFNLTVGQAALILVGLSFAGTVLISAFTMMLSEVTKNSIATIGIITGILLVTMFIMEMPANLKLLSEIWYLLPSNLVSLNGALRYSMFHVGGSPLAAYQYAPIVYLVLTVIFALIGKFTYNRYQINGR
ncbi:ABC transporter permease subunit [Mediterraneibacter sp. 210702-DFI.3.120]|uniref:ABC transporter permease subunit n=1 Tax=Lachnospiraceae TaxID=186803 RepID=UPI001D097852|nr:MULTISPECIES: ABC transporter permease subunit [Lachnospiraceae]MCB5937151.1 ABC transporter permease subunit [Lachnospiraceae bacterium 210521-DFI.3.107]MCB6487523.1 ABC transporter permease subunit [Mediterraneibacter sp. 210702-DFI.3.120]MCB6629442.1 ABC transporter permease subunit [Coprococcus eutactus]MCG4790584.1 ABC transporter permease subunit [Coprococcus eutactus]MCQ5119292.1 ABC transporter permease subunit [Coprococcus eutactus]